MADIDHAARIAEIRAQLEAATPGPWCPLIDREYEEFRPGVTVTPEGVSDSHGNWLFEASGDCTVADCVLAGSAPTHIRYLLDRVAELEHQLGEPTEPDDQRTGRGVGRHLGWRRSAGVRAEAEGRVTCK
jgi:hypothetical protein